MKTQYYVSVTYLKNRIEWIDECIVTTDNQQKIYDHFKKKHTKQGNKIKDIRIIPFSMFETLDL